MDRNAYRDDNDADQPRNHADHLDSYFEEYEPYPDRPYPYWRRRVATLTAGLGVLGLLAWAFSSGGGKPAPASQNSQAAGVLSAPAYPTVPAAGSGSGSQPVPGSASPSAGVGAGA
ncbi:MAG: hypothetical protein ACRDPD_16915, partial [Streptosporangiaceae bacterium]